MQGIPSSYLFVQPIRDSSSSRLVDDTEDVEARNRPCIFGGLTLRVIKVCRNCHDSVCDHLEQTVYLNIQPSCKCDTFTLV